MLLQLLAREQYPPVAGSALGFPRGRLAGRAISLFGSMQAAAPTTSHLVAHVLTWPASVNLSKRRFPIHRLF